MIDEKQEALDYLDGKHIMADNMYRTCVMLARYYKDEGFGHAKIRSSIFDWANRYHLYIRHDLNAIITYVMSSPMPLVANTVKINQRDREFISRITDNPKTQLIALAMLCYAKVYADKQKEFHISCVSLGAWIGIHLSLIHISTSPTSSLLFSYVSYNSCIHPNYFTSSYSSSAFEK